MKATLFDSKGAKKSDIDLPSLFDLKIREDIVSKYFEAEKFLFMQPYSNYEEAGKRHSASGTISHLRHTWKGHYGKGISRAPRKTMSRRGVSFNWVGAEISAARGGRMSHPPKGLHTYRKINKKEKVLAMDSALAATLNKDYISKRYSSLSKPVPLGVIESLPTKTKELLATLKKIAGDSFSVVLKSKSVRSGKGKRRGRKYKSNSGLLIVTGNGESVKFSGVEVKNAKEVRIGDLYPLGRLTLFTKKSLEEIKR